MKNLVLFILVLTWAHEGICQDTDSLNVYLVSLTSHLEYLKSVNKNSIQSVYLEKNDVTTEYIPAQIGGIRIFCLTRSEIRVKTSKGKRIELLVIRPVVVNFNSITVSIIDFSVTSTKNNFRYANGGGSRIEFTYDCTLNKFVISGKKQGGI